MENKTAARQILLVDDDVAFTTLMKEFLLLPGRSPWIVHTAENYTEALACLKTNAIDLIVLDIRLPIMDGLQFLTLLKQTHPGLPVIILTNSATEENRAYSLQHGAALFLDKVTVVGGFEGIYSALEAVAAKPVEGFRGMLRQVGLPDVLQMECLGRKSSVLEITGRHAGGRIFIQDGSIIHAECGNLHGEQGLFRLLSLKGGEFRLKPFTQPPRQTIDGHWESLLMEAARLSDEADARTAEESAELAVSDSPETGAVAEVPLTESSLTPDRRIEEIVLCSVSGEVLYEWQAQGMERRARLLDLLAEKSAMMSAILPLGHGDRLEIEAYDGRTLMLLQSDRRLFVRSVPVLAAESVQPSDSPSAHGQLS